MQQTPALTRLCETFGRVPKPRQIAVCPCCRKHYSLCMLLERPLRELSRDALVSYLYGVFYTTGSANDFRYFLPRLLELCTEPYGSDTEILLKKLRLAQWQLWPENERSAITGFLEHALDDALRLPREDRGTALDHLICGVALAELDAAPFLAAVEAQPAALADWYNENWQTLDRKKRLSNSFWQDEPERAAPIIEWALCVRVQNLLTEFYATQQA